MSGLTSAFHLLLQVQAAPLFSATPPPQHFQPAAPATATTAQPPAVDSVEADAVTPDWGTPGQDEGTPGQDEGQVASLPNATTLEGTTDGAPLTGAKHQVTHNRLDTGSSTHERHAASIPCRTSNTCAQGALPLQLSQQ